jgi:hypothetical protein
MRINNINRLVLSENTVDTGDFFDNSSVQGSLWFGKYCSNVKYTDNIFVNSGFMQNKEIAESDSIRVWAQINSQL